MKLIITSLLALFSIVSFAQHKILSEQEARELIANAKEYITTNIYEDDSEMYNLYAQKTPGDIIITSTGLTQIISSGLVTAYTHSMIVFDASKRDPKEIEKIQETIMSYHKFGISFDELAKKYASPETTISEMTIDSGDIQANRLFKTAFEEHSSGEMFVIKASENISYLVVLISPPVKVNSIRYKRVEYK